MLLKRYRRAIYAALPVGFALGGVVGLLMVLGSNRAFLTNVPETAQVVLNFALIGIAVSFFALGGGLLAVWIRDPHLVLEPRTRVRWSVAGAAISPMAGWLVAGAISVAMGDSATWFGLYVAAGAVTGLMSGIAALIMVEKSEKRDSVTTEHR